MSSRVTYFSYVSVCCLLLYTLCLVPAALPCVRLVVFVQHAIYYIIEDILLAPKQQPRTEIITLMGAYSARNLREQCSDSRFALPLGVHQTGVLIPRRAFAQPAKSRSALILRQLLDELEFSSNESRGSCLGDAKD